MSSVFSVRVRCYILHISRLVPGRCSPENECMYYRELDLCYNLNNDEDMGSLGNIKQTCAAGGSELGPYRFSRKRWILKACFRYGIYSLYLLGIKLIISLTPLRKVWRYQRGRKAGYRRQTKIYKPPHRKL